jgi:hypothetical protein
VLIHWWNNFPLISWIETLGYPNEEDPDNFGDGIQLLLPL